MKDMLTALLAGTALLSSMALTFVPAGMFHPTAAAAAPIAVDATGSGSGSSVSTFTASITTVAANTILLAWVSNVAGASASGTSSVTATGLTFTKRTTNNFTGNVSNGIDYELWWAPVATPGSYTVTAHGVGTYLNGGMALVSYKNVNQTAPFDPNFTLSGPAGQANNTSLSSSVAMASNLCATCNPGSMLVAGIIGGLNSAINAGVNGETQDLNFSSGGRNSVQHIANATGTFNLRAITWNTTQQYWGTIADALQPAYPASAIFIDATATGAMSTAASVNVTITTHVPNTIILAWVSNLGATAASSVSGGSLTWTKRKGNPDSTSGGTAQNLEMWWALKATAGSVTATATWGSSQSNAKINLVAYANVDTSNPFDPNGSLPANNNLNNGTSGAMTTASVSTSTNGSMLIGGFNVAGGNAYYPGTLGEVFDVSDQSNNAPVEHLSSTATFSSKAITFAFSSPSGGNATNWVSIVDALQPVTFQVDGTPGQTYTTAGVTSLGVNLTTTKANDVIVMVVYSSATGTTSCTVSSVSGGGLTWTRRNGQSFSTGSSNWAVEYWTAVASAPLSAASITATLNKANPSANSGTLNMVAFGLAGLNTANIFDSHSGLPVFNTSLVSSTTVTNTYSTSNAKDVILDMQFGSVSLTPPSGFTEIAHDTSGPGFWEIAYKEVAATQTSATTTTPLGGFIAFQTDALRIT